MGWLRFFLWVVYTLAESVVFLFTREKQYTQFFKRWSGNMMAIAKAKLVVEWRVDSHEVHNFKKAIVISNHQSFMDIFVLCQIFPLMKYLTKKELFSIPIFGWAMRKNGNVRVDRQKGQNDIEIQVQKLFEGNKWLYAAPEGTRSKDGRLRETFKSGAFWLAHKFRVPIVVLGLKNSRDVLPKGSFWVKSHQAVQAAVLSVLQPDAEPQVLKQRAYNILSAYLSV